MTTTQRRNKLKGKIDNINDVNIIDELNEVIDSYFLADKTKLSKNHKNAILEGISDIERGDFLTEQEANREIEQWLKK